LERVEIMKSYNKIKNEKKFQEYLDGLLLGDGSIPLPKERPLFYSQTVALSKIGWARKIQKDITNFGLRCFLYGPYNRFEVTIKIGFHPFLLEMYKRWYAKGKKRVPQDLIITPTILGNWYLGDGKLDKDDIIKIYTECFQFKEVEFLADLLNKAIGIIPFVKRNEKGNPIILIRACEVPTFLAYIPEGCKLRCFKYKFNVKSNHKRMKWLPVEDELLRNEYSKAPAIIISDKLKRGLRSIYHRANRLGLKSYARLN